MHDRRCTRAMEVLRDASQRAEERSNGLRMHERPRRRDGLHGALRASWVSGRDRRQKSLSRAVGLPQRRFSRLSAAWHLAARRSVSGGVRLGIRRRPSSAWHRSSAAAASLRRTLMGSYASGERARGSAMSRNMQSSSPREQGAGIDVLEPGRSFAGLVVGPALLAVHGRAQTPTFSSPDGASPGS